MDKPASERATREMRTASGLRSSDFDAVIKGKPVGLYVIRNANGLEAAVTNFGARLVSLMVPDRNGNSDDVVLGFDNLADYNSEKDQAYGATIGRYANRIGQAGFTLDGTTYTLNQNDGDNHLHGGPGGFHNVVWDVSQPDEQNLRFVYESEHLEEGYPGRLSVRVSYRLTDDNVLYVAFYAQTDRTTVVNMTHHSYFNLNGACNGDILDHELRIDADQVTAVGAGLIPTGEFLDVEGTPLDFRSAKPIGRDIGAQHDAVLLANGFDHNYVLNRPEGNDNGLVLAAEAYAPSSGRTLEVWTNEPGLQFYTGNWINEKVTGKCGTPLLRRSGFCFETQHYPDSPNHPHFPSTVLKPGEHYNSVSMYQFGVR